MKIWVYLLLQIIYWRVEKVENFIFTKLNLWQVCHQINMISFNLLFIYILCCWLPAAMSTTSSCHTAARLSKKQNNMECCYSMPPKIIKAKFGTSKQQRNMITFWFPRMYQLAGTWTLRKNSFIGRMKKKKKITSSSSLPSLRVGGIPGCLAVNNSIKLCVAWSLYKHTKGSNYDSQCSGL